MKQVYITLLALFISLAAYAAPGPITGPSSVCVGSTITLTDATTGGTWSSSASGVAPVGSASGLVIGASAGTATITYTAGGTYATTVITVDPLPAAITGATTVCASNTATLSDATSGGTWSSGNISVATAGAATGIITGVAAGTATITYTRATGCLVTATLTVNAAPVPVVVSPATASICNSSSVRLSTTGATNIIPIQNFETCIPSTLGTACQGWNVLATNTYLFQETASSNPTVTTAESGTHFLEYESFNAPAGNNATLYTPAFSLSGVTGATLSLWVYRDYGDSYSTSAYATEGITVYMNNSAAIGGTTLGFIPRDAAFAVTGFSGTSMPASSGWYNYTVTLPAGGATEYLLFYFYSDFGDNQNVDNISLTGSGVPFATTWSPVTSLYTNAGLTAAYTGSAIDTVYYNPTTITSTTTNVITASSSSASCGSATATATVTINVAPTAITGTLTAIAGSTSTISDATAGGTWSSSNTAVGSVGTTGIVTGIAAGTTTISYTTSCGAATAVFTVTPTSSCTTGLYTYDGCTFGMYVASYSIPSGAYGTSLSDPAIACSATGYVNQTSVTPVELCPGTSYSTTATDGGTYPEYMQVWIDFNNDGVFAASEEVATGGSGGYSPYNFDITIPSLGTSGVSYGNHLMRIRSDYYYDGTVATGCTTGYYGEAVDFTVDIVPGIPAISGASTVCSGSSITLSDATAGGTWSSSNTAIATVGTSTGMVTGVATGTAIITYHVSGGYAITEVTVSGVPSAITGTATITVGSSTTLSDAAAGGTWSSANTIIASPGSTGVITGVTAGTTTISYTTACGAVSIVVTVNPSASPCTPTAYSWTSEFGEAAYGADTFTVTGYGGSTLFDAGIVAASNDTTGYLNRTSTVPAVNMLQGGVYPAAATWGIPDTHQFLQVWIDFNNDGIFQASEQVSPVSGYSTGTTANPTNFNITIPATASTGNHLMRMRAIWETIATDIGGAPANADPCLIDYGSAHPEYFSGTATDYTVNILAGISGPTTVCTGASVTLTDPVTGGTWSSSNTAIATVGAGTGIITGIAAGTSTISYDISGSYSTIVITVNATPSPLSLSPGSVSICNGGSVMISTIPPGVALLPAQSFETCVPSTLGTPCNGWNVLATNTYLTQENASSAFAPTVAAAEDGANFLDYGSYEAPAGNTATIYSPSFSLSGVTGATLSLWVYRDVGDSYSSSAYATEGITVYLNSTAAIGGTTLGFIPRDGAFAVTGFSGVSMPTISGWYNYTVALPSGGPTEYALFNFYSDFGDNQNVDNITLTSSAATSVTWSPATGLYTDAGFTTAYTGTATDTVYYHPTTVTTTTTDVFTAATGGICPTTGSDTITVNANPATITGDTTFCIGGAGTLSDTTAGGTWSSSNTAIATVGTVTGVVSAVTAGTTEITYTSAAGCTTTTALTVNSSVSISVSATASCGGTDSLFASGIGTSGTYLWSPATAVACDTCASTVATTAVTTTYTVTGSNGSCADSATVTVNGNRISGFISLTGAADTLKVWLIKFNPSDSSLIAEDSTITCADGGTPYYEFDGEAAGSYMVKADLLSSVPGTSGWVPTYGLSTINWATASGFIHTTGTDTQHINMIYGTVPYGSGFIGGLISSGAGRGTSGAVPAIGMLVYLEDETGNMITYTYTGATGRYAFSGLANGTYKVYPVDYHYFTTPWVAITLSATADSFPAVNFSQFTNLGLILPSSSYYSSATPQITQDIKINVYPNPASNLLNINWQNQQTGDATISITNVTGQEVYRDVLDITGANGTKQLDIREFVEGVYFISIRSASMTYTSKLLIAH